MEDFILSRIHPLQYLQVFTPMITSIFPRLTSGSFNFLSLKTKWCGVCVQDTFRLPCQGDGQKEVPRSLLPGMAHNVTVINKRHVTGPNLNLTLFNSKAPWPDLEKSCGYSKVTPSREKHRARK